MELEPNRKLFPDHFPFILHGALGERGGVCWFTMAEDNRVSKTEMQSPTAVTFGTLSGWEAGHPGH